MKKTFLLIFILFILSVHSSICQQYYTRNYTINEGLPDNCIQDIFKDSRGFLWIGTNAGLAKFDGANFYIYSSQNGLAGDQISSIVEDSQGNIWIGCMDGGITRYNGKSFESFGTESGLISNEIKKLYFSNKHNLLLAGTEKGLSVFKNGVFNSYQERMNGVPKDLIITGFFEHKDYIFVFTNGNGLYKYTPELNSLIRIPSNHPLNYNSPNSVFISSLKDTLINFNRTSLKVLKNGGSFSDRNVGYVKGYVEDSENNVWIASWNNNYFKNSGLFRYSNKKIEKFNTLLGIRSENIFSLEFDNDEKILWIGTKDKGLYLFPQTNYTYFNAEDFNLNELNVKDVFCEKSGILWILTENNLIKKQTDGRFQVIPFDAFNKSFEKFTKENSKAKYSFLNDESGSYEKYQELIYSGKYAYPNPYQKYIDGESTILSPKSLYKPLKYDIYINKGLNEFNRICQDQNGDIWIGCNAGIFKINQYNELKYFDTDGIYFSDFAFDSKNRLLAVSWDELLIYNDIEGNSSYNIVELHNIKSHVSFNKIITHNNMLWLLSQKHGLFNYNKNNDISSAEPLNKATLYNDICFDKNGNIIKGGNNGNIYISLISEDSLKNNFIINSNNGLSGSSINWLNCTKENILIAGTNSGMNIINLNDLYLRNIYSIRKFENSDGFTDYTGKTSVLENDSILWIGSNKNLIRVELKRVLQSINKNFNFYIKSIDVNDAPLENENQENYNIWTQIPTSVIKLPYKKNSLTFNFDIIRYLDHEKIGFSYMLEGYYDVWSKETKDKKIVFQNLKPGNYRLRIKAFEKYFSGSNQELSISFKILPSIWLRWWFILFVSIALLFSIWFLLKLRIKSIKKNERQRTEIAERISEFELKALRAQMNPHFIFNAINSIQNYMLDNDVDSALNYLSDFAKLIRITLDNVSKKRITLEEELEYLKYYLSLEQMRFDKKFEADIILPADSDNLKILIPPMIIQPYIENSIKHGFANIKKGGIIKIEFSISEDQILKCIIEDNGIGREKSRNLNKNNKTHKSKGTFITTERLSLLNQTMDKKEFKTSTIDLYDNSNNSIGTRVEINMPI